MCTKQALFLSWLTFMTNLSFTVQANTRLQLNSKALFQRALTFQYSSGQSYWKQLYIVFLKLHILVQVWRHKVVQTVEHNAVNALSPISESNKHWACKRCKTWGLKAPVTAEWELVLTRYLFIRVVWCIYNGETQNRKHQNLIWNNKP